jgi:hypothetical protein
MEPVDRRVGLLATGADVAPRLGADAVTFEILLNLVHCGRVEVYPLLIFAVVDRLDATERGERGPGAARRGAPARRFGC